jgi:hypothetical protein
LGVTKLKKFGKFFIFLGVTKLKKFYTCLFL